MSAANNKERWVHRSASMPCPQMLHTLVYMCQKNTLGFTPMDKETDAVQYRRGYLFLMVRRALLFQYFVGTALWNRAHFLQLVLPLIGR